MLVRRGCATSMSSRRFVWTPPVPQTASAASCCAGVTRCCPQSTQSSTCRCRSRCLSDSAHTRWDVPSGSGWCVHVAAVPLRGLRRGWLRRTNACHEQRAADGWRLVGTSGCNRSICDECVGCWSAIHTGSFDSRTSLVTTD